MYRQIKNIIVQLRNIKNKISLNSDISLNTRIGRDNAIADSRIYDSTISNESTLNHASVFSSIIGNKVNINSSTIFAGKVSNNVAIGINTTISGSVIERYTYFAGNNRIFNSKIGAFCSIAENVSIGHAEHPYSQLSTSPIFYKNDNPFSTNKFVVSDINEFKETIIGNDVWIGLNSCIKSGVIVGNGAVIGAGAIVTRNVEPYAIVAGVPAKVIKKRFDELTITKLQNDHWWDMSDEELIKFFKMFNVLLTNPKIKQNETTR